MLLLDRVLKVDAEQLCAQVTIRADSMFCDEQGVGAWIGIEYMAQAIAAYAGYQALQRGERVKVGFLLGTRRYACSRPWFAVGTSLHVEVQQLLQAENGMGSFACTIHDSDTQQQLAQATVKPSMTPMEKKSILVTGSSRGIGKAIALRLARDNPDRQVVFFGLGFETTMPSPALPVLQAEAE
eukprot:gene34932-44776_t